MAARTRSPFVPTYSLGPAGWSDASPAPALFHFPFRLLILLTLLPLLLGVSLLVLYSQQQTDRIYPGVSVLGVSVGRMTHDQAAQAIKGRIQEIARRPFLLRYDDDAISVTLANLGLVVDDAQAATLSDRAMAAGRGGRPGSWFQEQLSLLRYGETIPASLQVDPERATAVLARVAVDVERPTFNASFSVEKAGERYEIHTSPARTGRRLNTDATIDRLQQSLASGLPNTLDLVLDEARPGIADEDIAGAADTASRLLAAPLELKDGARSWKLDPDAAFGMMEIQGLDTGHPPISVSLNADKLRAFVEKTARAADQPAQNPSFAIDGEQIVVRPGTTGKLADADATFTQVQQAAGTDTRSIDIVFKEDKPWLAAADLEPARVRANQLLDLPIILEAPPGTLPGQASAQATPRATAQPSGTPASGTTAVPTTGPALGPNGQPQSQPSAGIWVLDRKQLLQMIVLPATQNAPRDYATMPAAQRPRFELQLDGARVNAFLQREVAPWVSIDPLDAELQLNTTTVDVPNPAYAAAVEQRRQATSSSSGNASSGATATPGATATATPAITVPPTLPETHYSVGLRNARDGRGPDYTGTYTALQTLFRAGYALLPTVPASGAPGGAQAAPVAGAASAAPAVNLDDRRVMLRLAPRSPKVQDKDLAPARDQANGLIGEPIALRWKDATWTVSRSELSDMLRYQPANGVMMAYLTRDGLLAKAQAIAGEAERRPDAPRDSQGNVLPLDVPRTAAVIWELASTSPSNRSGEIVWTEEEQPPAAQ